MELIDWIYLNLGMNHKWTSFLAVGCHSKWLWGNKENNNDCYNELVQSKFHV